MKKALLKDAAAVVEDISQRLTNTTDVAILNKRAEQIYSLIDQRVSLTDSRKAQSALIGKARKSGDDFQALLRSSKELSNQLSLINSQIDANVEEVMSIYRTSVANLNNDTANRLAVSVDKNPTAGPGQFLSIEHTNNKISNQSIVSNTTDSQRWNEYVANNANATHYHQYQWRGIIERNFPQTCWYFIAENAHHEIVGVAASVHMDSRIFGSFMLSMPFLIYGGPLADEKNTSHILATHISTFADQIHCTHTELRETRPREGWHEVLEKVSMVLELPHSVSILNKTLGSKLRAQIKRAATEQPEFQLGSSELIPEFYAVFSRKMRDLGTPVYAQDFFQDIARTFPQSTYVAVVRLKGKPVAAAFLISYRDTLEIPWAASVRKFDRLGMNMFMYHALLEVAVKQGFNYFDFGRSTRGESTWRFKRQWGAQERQLYWHYLANDTPYDSGSGSASAKFTLAVNLWKWLPLWAANRIGPMIAKQLPW